MTTMCLSCIDLGGVFIFMCGTNMVTAALQNRVLQNPAVERWLEIPPRRGTEVRETKSESGRGQRIGVALTNLGMTLQRPKNSLLGAPQPVKPVTSLRSPSGMGGIGPFAKAPKRPEETTPKPSFATLRRDANPWASPGQSRFGVKRLEKQLWLESWCPVKSWGRHVKTASKSNAKCKMKWKINQIRI